MGSSKRYQIVFVASEVGPWSRTGGLGEVMDGLPIELAKMGHRVMTISPRWDQYYDAWDTSCRTKVPMGNTETEVGFFHCYKDSVDRIFIDHPTFLERVWGETELQFYGPGWGRDWNDNQDRFSLFCNAALEAIHKVPCGGFPYGDQIVLVLNDWHTSLCGFYMRKDMERWRNTKVCLAMHNLAFQGLFTYESWMSAAYNLSEECMSQMKTDDSSTACINWMKAGIITADKLLTVSPSYASEIMHGWQGSELSKMLCSHKGGPVIGILNGIKDEISPSIEDTRHKANMPATYDMNTLYIKDACKTALQKKLNLPVDSNMPMFMFIGRLDYQKGVDILIESVEKTLLMNKSAQVCIIGQGRDDMAQQVADLQQRFPDNICLESSFKGPDKYATFAGADFVMMPSRFEPCGLVQMECMRFGVIPIVAPTGGLKDTVRNMYSGVVSREEMTPESVVTPESVQTYSEALQGGMDIFKNKTKLNEMRSNCMTVSKNFSWENSAQQYVDVFDGLGVPTITA